MQPTYDMLFGPLRSLRRARQRLLPALAVTRDGKRINYRARTLEAGFSLIELMVAITIGLIILAALVSVFSSTRSAYQLDEGLARLQENARFAVETITRETRQAASMGCARGITPFNNVGAAAGAGYAFDSNQMIRGFEATGTGPGGAQTYSGSFPVDTASGWTPALDVSLVKATGAMPGSDVLVLRRISSSPVKLRPPFASDTVVSIDNTLASNPFKKDDVLIVYDCRHSSIFRVTNVAGFDLEHDATGNACDVWASGPAPCFFDEQVYNQNAEIAQVQTSVFFVSMGAGGVPALWQQTFPGGGAFELVEGVESMQVLYGVDNNGDARVDNYVTADSVADWSQVVAARVSLLLSTVNTTGTAADMAIDTNTYLLNGADAASGVTINPPDDRRRRRVFEATIVLRSRGF